VTTPARILVIDDDVFLSRAIERMLRPHEVTLANGGGEALEEVAQDDDFDVILCDIMMPEISGPEFYHRLAGIRPELQDRVLFMTGGALERVKPMLADIPNRLIEKPFTSKELHQMVGDFLSATSRSSE
jgi:two-component system NtrC family sensor kinase